MKQGWEIKQLGDVCESLFAGGDVPKHNLSKVPTDKYKIPIFSNGKKNDGLYGYTNIAKVTKPSITISARGTIGYSVIRNGSFYPVVRLVVLTPNEEIVELPFLYYAVKKINFTNSGSSIPQLTVPMVRKYEFPIPPLDEQKLIVAKLDECFGAIDKARANVEKNLNNAKELFQSQLNQIFSQKGDGWEEKKLGEVCEFVNGDRGKNYPNKSEYVSNGIPWINTGHILSNGSLSNQRFLFAPIAKVNE